MVRRRWSYPSHRLCWFDFLEAHRPARQLTPLQFLPAIRQLYPSVSECPHHHFPSSQAQRLVLPVQLIPLPFTGHGPIPLHHPLFFPAQDFVQVRSEEHTSELQSL